MNKQVAPDNKYKSAHVANFFIKKAADENKNIDLLKLVKLCYFGYGWVLSIMNGEKLIQEDIQAWQWGPVIPSVYHAFKHHGIKPITKFAPSMEIKKEDTKIKEIKYDFVSEETTEGRILSIVWNIYKNKDVEEILEITHGENTPWKQVYAPNTWGKVIKDNIIKTHYDRVIQEYLD